MKHPSLLKRVVRWPIAKLAGIAAVTFVLLGDRQARADMNLIEAFLAGNDLDCLDLWFEGFCMWVVITVTLFGVNVEFEMTPKISHFNPELLVSTAGRINNSPLIEGNLLYGTISREASKPIIALMNGGLEVPGLYDQVDDQFSSTGSSGGKQANTYHSGRHSYIYSEVDVIGAPGNMFTLYAEGPESFSAVPQNMLDGIEDSLSAAEQLPAYIEQVADDVAPGNGGIDDLRETDPYWEELPIDAAVLTQVATAILGEDAGALIEGAAGVYDYLAPQDFELDEATANQLAEAQDEIDAAIEAVTEIMGDVNDFLDDNEEIQEHAEESVDEGRGDVDVSDEEVAEIQEILTAELVGISIEDLAEELGAEIEELQAEFDATLAQIEELTGIIDDATSATDGAGFGVSGFVNLCRRDAETMKPYFISGIDTLAWRYRIPEMIRPQSYSLPIRGNGLGTGFIQDITTFSNHVGQFGFGSQTIAGVQYPDWNYWGPIYPRAGDVLQPDQAKARAVAASRAVHVVTRANEPHLYWHLEPREFDGWKYFTSDPDEEDEENFNIFDPQNADTGRWQLIDTGANGGSDGHSCLRFGDEDQIVPTHFERHEDGSVDLEIDSYAAKAHSVDGRRLYHFWRKKACCEDPDPPNGRSIYIGDFALRVPLL